MEVSELLCFLRSNSIPSYRSEAVVDGVAYDLSYKFKDSSEERVFLFCPGLSPDQIHKDFDRLFERAMQAVKKQEKKHNKRVQRTERRSR